MKYWAKTEFQIEVLTLVQNLMENRLRHARSPVHTPESVKKLQFVILEPVDEAPKADTVDTDDDVSIFTGFK